MRYGPTGRPEAFPAADIDFNGEVSSDDEDNFQAALDKYADDPTNYDPRADLVRDGVIDANDEAAFYRSYSQFNGLSGNWKLSQGDGLLTGKEPSGLDNRFGWRGYWYDPHLQKYHVRPRADLVRDGVIDANDEAAFYRSYDPFNGLIGNSDRVFGSGAHEHRK